jgi:hypothetical protein
MDWNNVENATKIDILAITGSDTYTVDVLWSETSMTAEVVIESLYFEAGVDKYVNVYHDSFRTLYYCEGFEEAVSELVGFDVKFTEFMAQDCYFSQLEAV